ncbi:MAG: hypothetical protein J7L69_11850 [Desulfobulbaceae bacterium]|nr:hypothetical protein [Desulfobulbaceae bacterium]
MEYEIPKTKCLLCGSEYSARGIGKHLGSCLLKSLSNGNNDATESYFHVVVQAKYDKGYFLHLLISSDTTLENLDKFLRNIWLECCFHESKFSRNLPKGEWEPQLAKSNSIKEVASIGGPLRYLYDFGSTTELVIRFVKNYEKGLQGTGKIQLLARNAHPVIPCEECGKYPAVQVCSICHRWDGGGWVCDKCLPKHDCEDEAFLPVVNSPRTGICSYTGVIEERPIPENLRKAIEARRKGES